MTFAFNRGRRGFTLVEVALAVAVGLIVIGGAIMGFNTVRDNATNAKARARVLMSTSYVEEFAAGNFGTYPSAAALRNIWVSKNADDWDKSPWGGAIGANAASGVVAADLSNFTGGGTRATAATLPDVAAALGNASALHYGTFTGWATRTNAGATQKYMRGYFIGLFDKSGAAYWEIAGGS